MHTVGPGIWQENRKTRKKRNSHAKDLEYGQRQWKNFKMRNVHCTTWNMARKWTNEDNEKLTY
jgi:hypothetical protein